MFTSFLRLLLLTPSMSLTLSKTHDFFFHSNYYFTCTGISISTTESICSYRYVFKNDHQGLDNLSKSSYPENPDSEPLDLIIEPKVTAKARKAKGTTGWEIGSSAEEDLS